jgi:hypothetical protein
LPFAGGDFIGSLMPVVLGGLVSGLGTEARAFDTPPVLEPLLLALSELPQAASDTERAATTGRTANVDRLVMVSSSPRN